MKTCIILLSLFAVGLSVDISCLRPCPMNYMPVCGSNGVTYPNKCAMTVAECELQTTLSVAKAGPCTTDQPIKAVRQTECAVFCTMQYAPVCGTDGHTYGNECQLTSKSCLTKSGVTKLHSGPCSNPVG